MNVYFCFNSSVFFVRSKKSTHGKILWNIYSVSRQGQKKALATKTIHILVEISTMSEEGFLTTYSSFPLLEYLSFVIHLPILPQAFRFLANILNFPFLSPLFVASMSFWICLFDSLYYFQSHSVLLLLMYIVSSDI